MGDFLGSLAKASAAEVAGGWLTPAHDWFAPFWITLELDCGSGTCAFSFAIEQTFFQFCPPARRALVTPYLPFFFVSWKVFGRIKLTDSPGKSFFSFCRQ